MGLLDRFFGTNNKDVEPEKSRYLKPEKGPKENEFAENFIQNGGKFIYCEDSDAVQFYFNEILTENNWNLNQLSSNSSTLNSFFKLTPSKSDACIAQVMHCEYLIANKGAILICSEQIKHLKLNELPENLIIIASTRHFKSDVSEAMTALNAKYKNNLPTNITTLHAFDPNKENDFLTYGSSTKNLYLLVQEVIE